MERRKKALFIVCQFLEEQGYEQTLKKLVSESNFQYEAECNKASTAAGRLMYLVEKTAENEEKTRKKRHELPLADGKYVNKEYCNLSGFFGGANVLTSHLGSDGVLASGCSAKDLYVFELGEDIKNSSALAIPQMLSFHSAAILCIDFHPKEKDVLLTGGMDRMVCLWDRKASATPLQHFKNHSKYVVRVKWSPSGNFFATASYDKSICIYRKGENEKNSFGLFKKLDHSGCIEAICFKKESDVLIAAVRDDNRLWIYDLSKENISQCEFLNMNAFGDDYVSFTAMDLNLSPNGKYLLVSTDQQRIILFDIDDGEQVANFYGVVNDEYSQPRNCWHPSGAYFYATSDDNSICVFEVSSGKIIDRLKAHEGRVRDLMFCSELSLLVSSGYDSTIRFWHQDPEQGSTQ